MLAKGLGTYAVLAFGLAAVGCAVIYEGKYDWRAGWRRAQVEAVQRRADLRRAPECDVAAQPTSTDWFARVAYRNVRMTWRRTVSRPDASVKKGDWVYVNITDCAAPLQHSLEH